MQGELILSAYVVDDQGEGGEGAWERKTYHGEASASADRRMKQNAARATHNGKNPILASILLFLVTIASASP